MLESAHIYTTGGPDAQIASAARYCNLRHFLHRSFHSPIRRSEFSLFAQSTPSSPPSRKDQDLIDAYRHVEVASGTRIAAARKLGIRLWIMMRDQIDYQEFCRRGKLRQSGGAHAGMPDFNSGPALQ